jgi:hypothetical protein
MKFGRAAAMRSMAVGVVTFKVVGGDALVKATEA